MNGKVCCILGVCCPPGSQEQQDALAAELVKDTGCTENAAKKTAEWILKHFDLAPKHSLEVLKSEVARLAREQRKG